LTTWLLLAVQVAARTQVVAVVEVVAVLVVTELAQELRAAVQAQKRR
jgi:hypothetical protein